MEEEEKIKSGQYFGWDTWNQQTQTLEMVSLFKIANENEIKKKTWNFWNHVLNGKKNLLMMKVKFTCEAAEHRNRFVCHEKNC